MAHGGSQTFARSVAASAILAAIPSSLHAQALVEWPVSSGGNGHWYELVPLGSSNRIEVAEYVARVRGGRLAELDAPGEHAFVTAAIGPSVASASAFMGAERRPLREPQLLDASRGPFAWLRDAASSRLVDIVLVGDSNVGFSGFGWDHGLQDALHGAGMPCAAIGPTPFNDDGGTVGWRWSKTIGPNQEWPSSLGNFATSTRNAPPQLAATMDFPNGLPNTGTGYAWLSSGTASVAGGMFLAPSHPFVAESVPFELRIQHGRFPKGGRFTPSVWRLDGSAMLIAPPVQCAAKSFGMAETLLRVPANFANGRALRVSIDGGQGVQAPFFLGWTTLERTGLGHGWCVSVLDWHGGASSSVIADDIESFSGQTSDRWVAAIRARQLRNGPGVRTLFLISSGMNDFLLTPDEHEAALLRMISHLSARWTAGGGNPGEIGFILMTSHDPWSFDPTEEIQALRARCRKIASTRSDVAAIDLGAIPMVSAFYAEGGFGSPHLSQVGYEQISARIVSALDGSQGDGCAWRWRSGAVADVPVDGGALAPCTRALCALGPWPTALRGVGETDELSYAVIEYGADCDDDGIVDRGAVEMGIAQDLNGNAIPDACECVGDIDQNGSIDSADLSALLSRWGDTGGGADLDYSGVVDAEDLVMLLSRWGSCPR